MHPQLPDPGAGRKPLPTLRRPSSLSKSATPATPATPHERPTPQRIVHEKFFISTTYSTIAARALSFQGQVLNGVTPLQLAQNGFHYQPYPSGVGGLACCFACQSAKRLENFRRVPLQETQQLHIADCIWQVIYNDLKPHLESADALPPSADASPPPRQSAPSPYLPSNSEQLEKTTTDASTQTQTELTPTVSTTAENRSNANLDSRAQPLSTTTDPESHLPPPTYSPQPPYPTSTRTFPPNSHQPTYASVLRHPPKTSPRLISKPRKSIIPTRPILTMEDLHRRFHNKPSPFQLETKARKRSARTRNKAVSTTKSLSRFLTSALPALSRFLAGMQPKPDTCCLSHSQIHYSRAMRAA
ncbi:hypothetical protein BDV38DRAFT_266754 [Aspergillus pseudotamarii]|uniref:Uncharacterized protein n=1 Tax=Aspergillus pseudotamarii TaxID=132259 RepID=A0A5N6SC06_ASPPS|nr:uncharacterized protein BDV38DRAFT_266754 [Aspergillus pseudotamarii]KAE8130654.1 hypothetical protein BDV38DRAFT_266754 [Aspergillus pseudotamarii]